MVKTGMFRVALIGCTLMLAACATDLRTEHLGQQVQAELIPGKLFVPNKQTIANVGDVMFTAGEYSKEPTSSKLESFRVKQNTTTQVKHKASIFEFSIPAGDYRLRSVSEDGNYYSSPTAFSALNDDTRTGYGGLFVPKGSLDATEIYWNWNPGLSNVYQAKLTAPISGTLADSIIYLNDQESSGPRATLTYAGVAAGQIRFVYKEFTKDGLARPAFTQEVSLDYKPGGDYAYKDAHFIVEKADSTHIRFTLLRPL